MGWRQDFRDKYDPKIDVIYQQAANLLLDEKYDFKNKTKNFACTNQSLSEILLHPFYT